MTNKTTEKLFTEEFLDNLNFLINHFNIEKAYQETIIERPTFDDPYDYTCDEELEELFEKFEDLFAEVKQQIDDYYNTDFTELLEFLYENQGTSYYDIEAKFNQYLQNYLD